MGRRKGILGWVLMLMAVAGWRGVAWAEEVLHLIHTADVRGTVGICG